MIQSVHFNSPPFAYYEGMWAKRTATADCSKKQLLFLLAKRRFTKLDQQILFALGQYGYLNAYLLRRYAALNGLRGADQSDIKERLSFLRKNGLIFRYEFFHPDPGTGAVNGSPFVYALSGGGWMFLKMSYKMHLLAAGIRGFYEFPDLCDQVRIAQILGLLSENQFAILFEDQYASRTDIQSDLNGEPFVAFGQRLAYRVTFPNNQRITVYPISVRQCAGWENIYRKHLSELSLYCKEHGIVSYSVLVICETSEHALACEKIKLSDASHADMDVFYGLDYTIAGSPDVLSRMLEIRRHGEHMSRNYFRLDLSGPDSTAACKPSTAEKIGSKI